ncbi:hypothetical protein DPEC_G00308810 [Dallia pectoralis]|uniref:Uncharacterized protein n=1 Tax=Dallia pectoralis TaxID=75939 RepID=A0ACC2FF35_DALPE|nr:hypothetical protein DPEC_G00308810 [Dallia pectoralis]
MLLLLWRGGKKAVSLPGKRKQLTPTRLTPTARQADNYTLRRQHTLLSDHEAEHQTFRTQTPLEVEYGSTSVGFVKVPAPLNMLHAVGYIWPGKVRTYFTSAEVIIGPETSLAEKPGGAGPR